MLTAEARSHDAAMSCVAASAQAVRARDKLPFMNKSPARFVYVAAAVFATALSHQAQAQIQPSVGKPVEQSIVKAVDGHSAEALALLERIVNINSGTMNFAGVRQVGDALDAAVGRAPRQHDHDSDGEDGEQRQHDDEEAVERALGVDVCLHRSRGHHTARIREGGQLQHHRQV